VSAELDRLAAAMRRHGLDAVLLSTPPSVTYASGWPAPLPLGFVADITRWLPALALVTGGGEVQLLVNEADAPAARRGWATGVRTFDVLSHFEPADPAASFRGALVDALRDAGLAGSHAAVGVEQTLPWLATQELAAIAPATRVGDATPAVEEARRVKTPREIELLRGAVAVADTGQRRLLELARDAAAPVVDTALWAEVVGAMEVAAGLRVPVSGSIQAASASADFTAGGPTGMTVAPGDPILLDIGPRVAGYWADCANTVVFGAEPTDERRRYLAATRDACLSGIEALRPGRRCLEVWQAVRDAFARHGFPIAHYAGHQVGSSVNERPRLLPFDDTVIEPGMIFAVEAGAYEGAGGSFGARAERVALVTGGEPEILSAFPWEL
jgi:Xaa-Pro aminopeptidase